VRGTGILWKFFCVILSRREYSFYKYNARKIQYLERHFHERTMTTIYIVTVALIGSSIALFTALTFLTRRPFTLKSMVVILFLAALISPMLVKMAYKANLSVHQRVLEFFRAAPFAFGPLLYFYSKIETGLMKRLARRDLLHFAPFVLAAVMMIVCGPPDKGIAVPSQDFRPGMMQELGPPDFPGPPIADFRAGITARGTGVLPGAGINWLAAIIFLSLASYTIMIIRLIRRHNTGITDFFSSETMDINLKWIKWITVCFLFSYMIVLIEGIFVFTRGSGRFALLPLVPDLATSFFIFIFSFFAIRQPELHAGIGNDDLAFPDESRAEKRYEKSGLKDETAAYYHMMILDFMAAEKPYTDPDLTINRLSERLGIPRHHLTQVLNEKINRNFFMFVNEYRIREIKERISTDAANEHSILRIAYEAGFNSKSTFNAMFKKSTGMTPSQYRKTIASK
jgi:AraC-like DNA-binding protein